MRTLRTALSLSLVLSLVAPHAFAQSMPSSFKDVSVGTPLSAAVEYLKAQGIIGGYEDGTFRPGNKVKRAEALKIIVAAVAADKVQPNGDQLYTDVPVNAWFAPYVTVAQRDLGIIDGPPKSTTFRPDANISKVEFLKLLFGAYKVDVAGSYSEIKLPLATDVLDNAAWYYPHMRYALSSSVTMVTAEGNLNPGAELTRGNIAEMMHRYLTYREGRRLQALLSVAETELVNVLQMIEGKEVQQAELASARALLAARGAHASKGDVPIVQGALKTTEAFRALVRAYRAGLEGRLDDVIALSKDAWAKADAAAQVSSELKELTDQLKTISGAMANEARAVKQGTPAQ